MRISTNESISIGLAHEFIGALTRRGVTRQMISDAVQNIEGVGDTIAKVLATKELLSPNSSSTRSGVIPLDTKLSVLAHNGAMKSIRNNTSIIRAAYLALRNDRTTTPPDTRDDVTIRDLLRCSTNDLRYYGAQVGNRTIESTQEWLKEHELPELREY